MSGTLGGGNWDRTPAADRTPAGDRDPGVPGRQGKPFRMRGRTALSKRLGFVPLITLFTVSAVAAVVGWRYEPPPPPAPAPPPAASVQEDPVLLDTTAAAAAGLPQECRSDVVPQAADAWTGDRGRAGEVVFQENAAALSGPIVIGENGFAFWSDMQTWNFSQTLGRDPWTEDEVQVWVDGLTTVRDELAADGRELLVVVAPSVGGIYPQDLPAWAQPLRGAVRFDQLLAASGDLPIVDLRGALLDAAEQTPVFSAVNSHWTPYGAAVAWAKAQECLAALDPAYAGLTAPDVSEVESRPAPSEYKPYGHEFAPEDWTVPASLAELQGVVKIDGNGNETPVNTDIDLLELPLRTSSEAGLDKTVLFARDSMGNSLSPWVADDFTTVCHAAHGLDYGDPALRMDVAGAAKACDADLVVLEFTERYLGYQPL